MFVILSVNI